MTNAARLSSKPGRVGVGRSKMTVFGVHKDMSNFHGEGIDKKLKSTAQLHKRKVLKKVDRILC